MIGKKKKMFYGFDCENDGKNLTCGSIVGKNYEFSFFDVDKFLEEIEKDRFRNSILFATNLEYDIGVLLNNKPELKQKFSFVSRGGRMIACRYKTKHHSVTFGDTMNFTPHGVKKLGEMIGLRKLKAPSSWERPKTCEDWKYLQEYNIQDSKISYLFMENLRQGFDVLGGDIKTTISSTALHIWRKNFYTKKLRSSEFIDEEQASYYGGRTEAFKRGYFDKNINPVYVYDFSSHYPASMLELKIPIPDTAEKTIDKELKREGISYVNVVTPKNLLIPLLPVRQDKKLIFPVGKFSGWYTHLELRKAKEIGYKINVVKSITYETEDMFSGYVTKFYALKSKYKKEGNEIMTLISKLMLNSLYGKFATKLEVEKIVHVKNLSHDEYVDLMERGNKQCGDFIHYTEDMPNTPDYVQPIVSSYITSHARIKLYEAFESVGLENVIYCDTDSIFCLKPINEVEGLGGLEREYTGGMYVVRPKVYAPLNDGDKYKGIRVKGLGREIKDLAMFKKHILGQKRIDYTRLSKIRESNRRGFYYGEEIKVFKELNLEDTKRLWLETFPFTRFMGSEPLDIQKQTIKS